MRPGGMLARRAPVRRDARRIPLEDVPSGSAHGSTMRTRRRNSTTSAMSSSRVSRTMIFSPPMRKSVVSGVASAHPMWSGLIATRLLLSRVSLITASRSSCRVPLRATPGPGAPAPLARKRDGGAAGGRDGNLRRRSSSCDAGLDYHLARHNLLDAESRARRHARLSGPSTWSATGVVRRGAPHGHPGHAAGHIGASATATSA